MKREPITQDGSTSETVPSRSLKGDTRTLLQRLSALLQALRPRQWTKNLAVCIGLVFAQRLFTFSSLERGSLALIIFCLASSCTYLINDLLDLEQDRQHPVKCKRPLASGALPVSWAIAGIALLLLLCGLFIGVMFTLPTTTSLPDLYHIFGGATTLFTLIVASYLLLMLWYSLKLKHIVLIDVFVIASGFIARVLAGAVVIPVAISPWLVLVTCFLSLFLALGKRRHELGLLQGQASQHRRILQEYSLPLLDQMMTIVVTGTMLAYSLYTIEGPTGGQHLILTIPLVLYGVFRYLYLIYMRMEGGSPEEVLLRDRHVLGTVLLYIALVYIILYIIPS